MKLFVISYLIFSVLSFKQNDDEKINAVLESYKNAINDKDYNIIQPYLSNDFQVDGSGRDASLVQFYSYINFKLSERIKNISLVKWRISNDTIIIIEAKQTFENNNKQSLILNCIANNGKLKIYRMTKFLPNEFSLTTRASYINDEVFGNNRIENIKKLSILDNSSADSYVGKGYVVYFSSSTLKSNAQTALNLLELLDSVLTNKYGFRNINHQNLFLISTNSKNTCTVGKNDKIPWIFPLYEKDEINHIKLINIIGNSFSHEIIEGTLVHKYKLNGYTYRWFREGLSEYLAYKFCTEIAPNEAQQFFLANRLSDAFKFKKNGNLLDWRADSPIPEMDKGKLYGDKFIYSNDVGQYGRIFKLFKDLFDNNEYYIPVILKKIIGISA
ncbi:MAG: hypothetical protein M0R39_12040 [Prolixibacteraceae bacterium]|nr:hypothetical protein [Prolixibacteraceae bacterium]